MKAIGRYVRVKANLIRFFTILLALSAGACTVREDIIGNGNIVSDSGLFDCQKEQAPCDSTFAEGEDFSRVLEAIPEDNWFFSMWKGCTETNGNICVLNGVASSPNMGESWTLSAYFRPNPNVLLDGRDLFEGAPFNQGFNRFTIAGMSADGRYTAFSTLTTSFDEPDVSRGGEPERCHLFDRNIDSLVELGIDVQTKCFIRNISADGRFLVLAISDNLGESSLSYADTSFLYNIETKELTPFIDGGSFPATDSVSEVGAVSSSLRYVSFRSRDEDLFEPDTVSRGWNVFVYDRIDDILHLVPLPTGTVEGFSASIPISISSDGSLLFRASAHIDSVTLRDYFIYDRLTESTELLPQDRDDQTFVHFFGVLQAMSDDGNIVVYNYSNNPLESYGELRMLNRTTGRVKVVSRDAASVVRVSSNGRFISYRSTWRSGQAFLTYDIETQSVEPIFPPEYSAHHLELVANSDGRFIAYNQPAPELSIAEWRSHQSVLMIADRRAVESD